MIDIQRIVCAVDFSEFSRRALDLSIGLARWYEARVSVVHVYSVAVAPAAFAPGDLAVVEPIAMSEVDRESMMGDLAAFARPRARGVPIELRLAEGTVWREIVGTAAAVHADLLMLGTHGRSGFERLLLGSVAEKVLRTAPCPVLTVPPAAPDVDADNAVLFKRLLFATDFSAAADAAGRWAASLTQEADGELTVLHVLETPFSDVEGFPRSALAAYRREYEQWSATQLHSAVGDTLRAQYAVREVMAVGSPHREILRVAAEHGCDLVVMGVAGHRGIGDRVFGSTTQHVVRGAHCPVLTVRS